MEDQKTKRPRIEKRKKPKGPVYRPDLSVWKIIEDCRKKHLEEEVIDLSKPYYKPTKAVKMRTMAYADLSITEAFNKAYGTNVGGDLAERANQTPTELRVDQLIPLRIASITKSGITFDSNATKQVIETRNNFYHYEKMREHVPTDALEARVIDVNANRVMVDLFGPMVEKELSSITSEPWRQNTVKGSVPSVTVKNLHMVRGGFKGRVVLNGISDFLGDDYELDAFIPGSQICLNITDDFEQYEGQTVRAMILSSSIGPNGKRSVVCSVKRLLQHMGNLKLMEIHSMWCDQEGAWKEFSQRVFDAKVTGVINSSKQCGVFVEIPELNITGMIRKPADELVNYAMGTAIKVSFDTMDEALEYNDAAGQFQHLPPFEIEDGALKKVNIKPIFKQV